MRSATRLASLAVGAVLATLAVGPVQAAAGGPTSVLITNPSTGATSSLYVSDDDYARLADALEAGPTTDASPQLASGPGSSAINVTWLAHDVSVWRVDRVQVDADGGLWVQTSTSNSAELALTWQNDTWHRPAEPDQLVAVLDRLGVLDRTATKVGASGSDSAGTTAGTADDDPVGLQRADPAESAGTFAGWWWVLPGLAAGVGAGMLARPTADAWARRRPAGPRHELIDL